MSAIKYQLRELVASLSGEANKIKDPEVKRRLYLIKAVVESKKDVKKTCEMRGVSTDYFYKWSRRFLELKNLSGLGSKSRTVKEFWNKTSRAIEKKIVRMRKQEPFKGPERISYDLKKRFNIICAVSTVAAILKRRGLVTKEYRDRLTKKHMKRYRRPLPGYLQMDFKYTPFLVEGEKSYQLSVVDHHSSWRFIRSYQDRKVETVIGFLNELDKTVPFPIEQIQTDNAMEFTDKFTSYQRGLRPTESHAFDVWCRKREIEHKLIPIGQKEINGKVENTHRFDDREFFSQINVNTFSELELATRDYNRRWNEERPTKALEWLTPSEVVERASTKALMYLVLALPNFEWKLPAPQFTQSMGVGSVTGSKEEIKRIKDEINLKIKKPKKISATSRYLQYMDWDAKNKLKIWAPVPMILQNFSRLPIKISYSSAGRKAF